MNISFITANKYLLDSKYFQAEKRGDWYLVSGKYFERVLWFNGYENPITMRRFKIVTYKYKYMTRFVLN